ncbi:MAG: carboxypeptidase regulatory-like domain-containing protein [Pirellulales bacterium]
MTTSGTRACASCGSVLTAGASTCPACGAVSAVSKPPPPAPPKKPAPPPPPSRNLSSSPVPPPRATPAAPAASPPRASSPAPLPSASPSQAPKPPASPAKPPPPPSRVVLGPTADGKLDELQRQALALQRSVKRQRLGSWLLAAGTLAALLLAILAGLLYHRSTVMSYAELAESMGIARDPVDHDRLTITFQPVTAGRVGFRRRDENRDTELLDRVAVSNSEETLQWRWSGVKPGDVVKVRYRDGWSLRTRELTVPEPPSKAPLGTAKISGQIVSATTGQPVPDAQIRVSGTPLKATTDAAGKFTLQAAPAGPASMEISAAGYSTEILERELTADGGEPVRVALSPGLAAGQIRFVLTWGAGAKDLDAHLEGPLPGEQRFHVFHKQKGDLASQEFVSLDVDDRDGDGPETITVLGVQPGRYHYFVHNADTEDGESSAKTALSRSLAEVKVYQGGQTYRFRPLQEGDGNLWRVCDLVIDDQGKATVTPINKFEFTTEEQQGLYAKRTQANREQWIVNYGGTPDSEKAVFAGLEWLARHQAADGHWGPDCLEGHANCRCEGHPQCSGNGGEFAVAQTGLAVLAFQAGGHFHDNNRKYSEHVRRGLDWLVAQQKPDGCLYMPHLGTRHPHFMYEHGIASFAICEANAIGVSTQRAPQPKYREAAEQAIRYILRIQHNDGGWRYSESKDEESDISITGWQVLALKSAKEAHLDVPDNCVTGVERFLRSCQIGRTGRTAYTSSGQFISEATTGVGMLIEQFLLGRPDAEYVRLGADYLAKQADGFPPIPPRGDQSVIPDISDHHDYYLLYNCTLAMFQRGEDPWKRWNDAVRDRLIGMQRTGSDCVRGSWEPDPRWGSQGGRVYSTALAILTLEVYYRYNSDKAKVYSP